LRQWKSFIVRDVGLIVKAINWYIKGCLDGKVVIGEQYQCIKIIKQKIRGRSLIALRSKQYLR
jgi:hypothetical protein